MNHKQPMTLQVPTSADDAEERLRISLSRIGTQKNGGRPTRPHQLTQPVRRRFVRDGEVPTEYAGRGPESAASAEADEALSALRAELAAGNVAREEAEQALAVARAANRTLQTRVGHMELELQELRARAAEAALAETTRLQEARLQEAKLHEARLEDARLEEARLREERTARPVRASRRPAPAALAVASGLDADLDDDDDDADPDGPQPVKWWLKR